MAYSLTYTLNSDGASYSVSGYSDISTSDNVEIPSIYNDKPVTWISHNAFAGCTNLTSITIGNNVMIISYEAFAGCSNLQSITIPDGVTTIGDNAFDDCSSLATITIPNSVTSIGSSAFYNTAYYNDEQKWENGILYIGKHLIKAKTDLSDSYTIKDGTLTIADSAFQSCIGVTSITIPDSVTSIGYAAFGGCSNLIQLVLFPEAPPTLGSSAIPNNVQSIYVKQSSKAAYQAAINWVAFTSKIVGDNIYLSFVRFNQKNKEYINEKISEFTPSSSINVVQTTGNSETDVMSQKATTDEIATLKGNIFDLNSDINKVNNGEDLSKKVNYEMSYGAVHISISDTDKYACHTEEIKNESKVLYFDSTKYKLIIVARNRTNQTWSSIGGWITTSPYSYTADMTYDKVMFELCDLNYAEINDLGLVDLHYFNELKSNLVTKDALDNMIVKECGINLYDEEHNSVIQSDPQFTIGTVYFDTPYTGYVCISVKGNSNYIDSIFSYDSEDNVNTITASSSVYNRTYSREGIKLSLSNSKKVTFRYRTDASTGTLIEEVMVTFGDSITDVIEYEKYKDFYSFTKDDYVRKSKNKQLITVYVSNDGDDNNDGLSESTAVATFSKALTIGYNIKVKRGEYNEVLNVASLSNISITPFDNDLTYEHAKPIRDKIKIIGTTSNTNVGLFDNCDNLFMEDVIFSTSDGSVLKIINSNNVTLNNCEVIGSATNMGFEIINSDVIFNNCYATENRYDGFNFHGYGTTVMNDCVSENNQDDGCSHHDGCIGTINGGRFSGNGKCGIAPAYGADVNIYNSVCKNNPIGISYLSTNNGHTSMKGIISNCVMVGNTTGLQVDELCDVTSINCKYSGNEQDKYITGTLTEY